VKVEIWSDVVCPWCYIGKRRFESALAEFGHRDEIEVRWRSFELDPTAPRRRELPTSEHLAQKYGMTVEQAVAAQENVSGLAAAEGLDYHLESSIGGNSFDAHRLLQLAAAHGVQDELKERLLSAYFIESEAIGDREVLGRLAVDAGLDEDEVAELLAGDRFGDAVREDERLARELGINGVPFFAIDNRYGVSGAQPAEVILAALNEAWATHEPEPVAG
jgi:predicted DsbA family dithiol-disulfide isomerase